MKRVRACLPSRRHLVWALLPCALLAACGEPPEAVRDLSDVARAVNPALAQRVVGGDTRRGRDLLRAQACTQCHIIPGERAPQASIGPPLTHFARRTNIGGSLPNQPEQLVRFLMNAPLELPGTGMPDLPLQETQARDIAAFLYTLR